MKYPKIKTLWNRDLQTFGVIPGDFKMAEFALISKWLYTEKIDGQNIRIIMMPDGAVDYRGRTDNAQLHPLLLEYLRATFTAVKMQAAFDKNDDDEWPFVILYGEGYGPKIQKGGKYRSDMAFRLFDVRIGDWWLNWYGGVADVARTLGIDTAPILDYGLILPTCHDELRDLIDHSVVAWQDTTCSPDVMAEGIVARTEPLLFTRRGDRVMWKLKFKDFK